MSINCQQLKQQLEELKSLKKEFDLELENAKKTGEIKRAKELKEILEKKRDEIQQKILELKQLFDKRYLPYVEKKEKYKVVETLEGHKNWISALQVLPDGRIVSGSWDTTIKIWTKQGNEWQVETLEGHEGRVFTLQVLPDGRIVSGSGDNTIKIWTKQGNEWQVETLKGHKSTVFTLQVLPDGRIVSGSGDGTIKIWTKQGNKWQVETLEGHEGRVDTFQVLPDGRIVSGSEDRTIKIWDGQKIK